MAGRNRERIEAQPAAGAAGGRQARAAGLPHLAAGRRPRLSSSASSSSSCSPTGPTSPTRRSPTASSIRAARSSSPGDDIRAGQKVFLHHGLMEYGSIFGHGAYLGPDFTADYLHRASASVRDQLGGERLRLRPAGDDRPVPGQPLRLGHQDAAVHAPSRRAPSSSSSSHYADFFDSRHDPVRPAAEADQQPEQIHELTAFFAWSAWAASARRPGHNYSYTNNWPPEEQVGNAPSANVIVWSVISLIALLGGIGILFAAFGRWRLGWQGRDQATLSFRAPGDVALTPAQRATAWFFFVMAALFLLQTLVGGHVPALPRRARRLLRDRPRPGLPLQPGPHLARAAGDLLRRHLVPRRRDLPGADDRRPRAASGQGKLAFALLGALAVVVFGSLIGEFADIHNWFSGLDLRRPGLRVPRPRPLLAGPAGASGSASGS